MAAKQVHYNPNASQVGAVSPEADSRIVDAAKDGARWAMEADARTSQAKHFMDLCGTCPSEVTLQRLGTTLEEWRVSRVDTIKAQLESDPDLKTFRWINKSTYPLDGWTALHYAAFKGNTEVMKVLLANDVSSWAVDFQGRTALALAAQEGHGDASVLLMEHMKQETGSAPVGTNAPVDFAGRTPLGGCNRTRLPDEVKSLLYARGDASICPITPLTDRSGGVRMVTGHDERGLGLIWGHSTAPGWSRHMQDELCSHDPIDTSEPGAALFGVFDGHGSSNFTSAFVAGELRKCFLATRTWKSGDRRPGELKEALEEAFVECDRVLATKPRMALTEHVQDGKSEFQASDTSGSTAVVALISATHCLVANAGDSRAILITASIRHDDVVEVNVSEMSKDHTAAVQQEKERIEAAGGTAFVMKQIGPGVRTSYNKITDGISLSPSRGFGDLLFKQNRDAEGHLLPVCKQVVSVFPEIKIYNRGEKDKEGEKPLEEFLLLASDGLWDVFEKIQEAGNFFISQLLDVSSSFEQVTGEHLARACDALVDECMLKGSRDNITAQVVWMGRDKPGVRRALFNK